MSMLWKILVLAVVVGAGIAVVVKKQSEEQPIAAPDRVEQARYLRAIAPPDADEPVWSRQYPTASDTPAGRVPDVQSNQPVSVPMPAANKAGSYAVPTVRSILATPVAAPPTGPEAIPSQSQAPGEQAEGQKVVGSVPGREAKSAQVDQEQPLPETTVPPASNTKGQGKGAAEQLAAAPDAPGAPLAVHRVGRGDSLYKLAGKYYGDSERWKLILDANPSLQGGLREMRLGTELIIPALPPANP